MGKNKSFAAKMGKSAKDDGACPQCGEVRNSVLVVASEKKESTESWKFKEKIVQVCKCNENEVYA
ncbi:hypothetical protein H8E88_17825 [candidate division KSB1 bacterium]|nr:hypothetical protein [candidate division KSB1 bacterium]MBL7093986.1 hypothetical protein [candidate division KSB1 bacterium]